MSFGKRPSSAAAKSAPPVVDPYGRRKVIPEEAWQGKTGEMLRELGMSPDDESNLIANTASINARLDAGKSALEARLAKAQANARALLPQAELRAFSLIPDPCWNGDTGVFLMASLDLYPYDDWNIVFLAADERTAMAMDIAIHPNGNVPAFVTAAEKFLAEAQAHLKRATDEAELTHDFAGFHDVREDVQLRVKGLAMSFARALIEAWDKRKG